MNHGSKFIALAMSNMNGHTIALTEHNRSLMHDARAHNGKLQHFFVGNLRQAWRLWNQAWIGGVDAIHIGVNFAAAAVAMLSQWCLPSC